MKKSTKESIKNNPLIRPWARKSAESLVEALSNTKRELTMKLTRKLPTKEGYYWWTNFGEHTPTILRVERVDNRLYASNEEYSFFIELQKIEKDPDMKYGKYYFGEELWCYIPNPKLDGKEIKPDSY